LPSVSVITVFGLPLAVEVEHLRGTSALTGLALTGEIGDWYRFTGSSIGADVGPNRPRGPMSSSERRRAEPEYQPLTSSPVV
jgi:hypothetical protein